MTFILNPPAPEELTSQTTSEFVYQRLREAIQTGKYAPYDRLAQEAIADQLHVSRTPVREALSLLAHDGVAMWTRGRGYVVPDITKDDIRQVHHVRRALECLGVEEAASNYTTNDLYLLRTLHEDELAADPTSADYYSLNRRLHMALIQPAHNPVLIRLLDQVWRLPATRAMARHYIENPKQKKRSFIEHEAIIEAAGDRDPKQLTQLLSDHINNSYAYITELITPPN